MDCVRAVKTITVKPFRPILMQPAIAIMDRRVGITRCRALILLSRACVWTVARVCNNAPLCSRQREKERRVIILDFWKECFSPTGRKGFRDPWTRGVSWPLDGRLSRGEKWDSRVVGNLLCCWRGHTSEGKFVCSRDACNRLQLCVRIGYGDWLWQVKGGGWINFWLWVFCFPGVFEGKYWEIRASIWLLATCLFFGGTCICKNIIFLVAHIGYKVWKDVIWYHYDHYVFFFFSFGNIAKGRDEINWFYFINLFRRSSRNII